MIPNGTPLASPFISFMMYYEFSLSNIIPTNYAMQIMKLYSTSSVVCKVWLENDTYVTIIFF